MIYGGVGILSRLWARVITDHKIEMQDTYPCQWGEESRALTELCKQFDIPSPIWLPKHEREYESFRRTAFLKEHFVEEVGFDRLEIEFLDDTGKKRRSMDPRNQF